MANFRVMVLMDKESFHSGGRGHHSNTESTSCSEDSSSCNSSVTEESVDVSGDESPEVVPTSADMSGSVEDGGEYEEPGEDGLLDFEREPEGENLRDNVSYASIDECRPILILRLKTPRSRSILTRSYPHEKGISKLLPDSR